MILLVLGLLLFTSCINDDTTSCEESTVHLDFKYFADGDVDVISSYIHKISLFIYNEDTGVLVDRKELKITNKSDASVWLSHLPVGNYTLVAWGNINEFTKIQNSKEYSKGSVQVEENVSDPSRLTNSDKLYYSQSKIRVESDKPVTQDLIMTSAHIKFDVFVKGISATPILTLNNFVSGYTMDMKKLYDPSKVFSPILNSDKDGYKARFSILRPNGRFTNETLSLITRDGVVYDVNLNTYLNQYYQDIAHLVKQEIKINILFEFSDLGVNVSVPDWDIEDDNGSMID